MERRADITNGDIHDLDPPSEASCARPFVPVLCTPAHASKRPAVTLCVCMRCAYVEVIIRCAAEAWALAAVSRNGDARVTRADSMRVP